MCVVHYLCLVVLASALTHATQKQIPSSYLSVVLNAQRILQTRRHKADELPKIPAAFLRRLSGDYILSTVEDVLNSGVLQGHGLQPVPSTTCLNHTVVFLEGVVQQQRWALSSKYQ